MARSQVAIIGTFFTILLVIFIFQITFKELSSDSEVGVDFKTSSKRIAEILLKEGLPNQWTSQTVKKPGILYGSRISIDKLIEFSDIPYEKSKLLLSLHGAEYMIRLVRDGSSIVIGSKDFLGWTGIVDDGNGGKPFYYYFTKMVENAENIYKFDTLVTMDDGKPAEMIIYAWNFQEPSTGKPECNDEIDNDNDGKIDMDDLGCESLTDNDETDKVYQCSDTIDNDGDGWIDLIDPGCEDRNDDDETNSPLTLCSDGIDNDGDGLIDGYDPVCTDPADNVETTECEDGVDNDFDSLCDFNGCICSLSNNYCGTNDPQYDGENWLADPGCSSLLDDDESDATTECQDTIDNDGDLLCDTTGCYCSISNNYCGTGDVLLDGQSLDGDPGCSDSIDDDESDGTTECQDGIDNDGDGWIDFDGGPLGAGFEDWGCESFEDDDETNDGNTVCSDGLDNNGDGLVDRDDPNCINQGFDWEGFVLGNGNQERIYLAMDDGIWVNEDIDATIFKRPLNGPINHLFGGRKIVSMDFKRHGLPVDTLFAAAENGIYSCNLELTFCALLYNVNEIDPSAMKIREIATLGKSSIASRIWVIWEDNTGKIKMSYRDTDGSNFQFVKTFPFSYVGKLEFEGSGLGHVGNDAYYHTNDNLNWNSWLCGFAVGLDGCNFVNDGAYVNGILYIGTDTGLYRSKSGSYPNFEFEKLPLTFWTYNDVNCGITNFQHIREIELVDQMPIAISGYHTQGSDTCNYPIKWGENFDWDELSISAGTYMMEQYHPQTSNLPYIYYLKLDTSWELRRVKIDGEDDVLVRNGIINDMKSLPFTG